MEGEFYFKKERRENPEYGARTNASYKLQNAMQLSLEPLRFGTVLYFKDAHSHEDTAGEGRCYASL
jgi:hypothetical protein